MKGYEKPFYRPLDILDGIDISSIKENFFEEWKQINFYKIFDHQLDEFLKKVSLFISEIKDFSLLFSFYDIYQDKEYRYEAIITMQNRFKEIFNTYTPENCPNFKNDLIKLIYLSDKKKVNLKKFLVDFLQSNLDVEKVNEIYLQLIEEHQDLSKDIKGIIVEHFTKNKNNSNPTNLLFLLKICKKLRKEIFSNINKYIIKEEEFLCIEETENYQFFKGIIKNGLLEKANQEKGGLYIEKAISVISSLENKIKNDEISFNKISIFFPEGKDDKKEKILYERILYINLLDENKAKENFEHIKKKVNTVRQCIKNLEIIHKDLIDFFYISCAKEIEGVCKMLFEIKDNPLNYLTMSH